MTPTAPASAIVAPVSRLLAVSDLDRALAFYRDVLGFAVAAGASEAVSGPARIQFSEADAAYDSTGDQRPRGSAVLFFEVKGIEKFRDAIAERGGDPGAIEKANWIKMRVFQLRDPDGHALWFAESYAGPEKPSRDPMCLKTLPDLPVSDEAAAIRYYGDVLGFTINYAQDGLGVMDRDEITVLLSPRSAEFPGPGRYYVYVRDADALLAELRRRGATVHRDIVSWPWGLRDFVVGDPDGNLITFGQPFE